MKSKFLILTLSILTLGVLFVIPAAGQNGADVADYIVSGPKFVLSDEAIAAGIDGVVRVSLKIDKTGAVKRVDLLNEPAWPCGTSPDNALRNVRRAIADNLRATIFKPVLNSKGEPDTAQAILTFAIGKAYEDMKAKEGGPRVIDGGVVNGRAIHLQHPDFPPNAPKTGTFNASVYNIETWVLIDEDGKVEKVGTLMGDPIFWRVSRQAACDSRFSPTLINGRPVKVVGKIVYSYDTQPTMPR
jgi:hypothetical protein